MASSKRKFVYAGEDVYAKRKPYCVPSVLTEEEKAKNAEIEKKKARK